MLTPQQILQAKTIANPSSVPNGVMTPEQAKASFASPQQNTRTDIANAGKRQDIASSPAQRQNPFMDTLNNMSDTMISSGQDVVKNVSKAYGNTGAYDPGSAANPTSNFFTDLSSRLTSLGHASADLGTMALSPIGAFMKAVIPKETAQAADKGVNWLADKFTNIPAVKDYFDYWNNQFDKNPDLKQAFLQDLPTMIALEGTANSPLNPKVDISGLKATMSQTGQEFVDGYNKIKSHLSDMTPGKPTLNSPYQEGQSLLDSVKTNLSGKNINSQLETSANRIDNPVEAYDKYSTQAKLAKNDVMADTPLSQVGEDIGNSYDKVIKMRQAVGKTMGSELESIKGVPTDLNSSFGNFEEELAKQGLTYNAETGALESTGQSSVSNFDKSLLEKYTRELNKLGANPTVGELDSFMKRVPSELDVAKASANITDITNGERVIKSSLGDLRQQFNPETTGNPDLANYYNARQQYSQLSDFLDEGNKFLGNKTQAGDYAKDASIAKSSVQSLLNNGKKDWLAKLEGLTGDPVLDKSVVALQAMKDAGDARGASLLQMLSESDSPSGLTGKVIKWAMNKGKDLIIGSPEEQTRTFLQSLNNQNIKAIPNSQGYDNTSQTPPTNTTKSSIPDNNLIPSNPSTPDLNSQVNVENIKGTGQIPLKRVKFGNLQYTAKNEIEIAQKIQDTLPNLRKVSIETPEITAAENWADKILTSNKPNPEAGFIKNPLATGEAEAGWGPGMKANFDEALSSGDANAIHKMLPEVPDAYKFKFADKINGILDKAESNLQGGYIKNPLGEGSANEGLQNHIQALSNINNHFTTAEQIMQEMPNSPIKEVLARTKTNIVDAAKAMGSTDVVKAVSGINTDSFSTLDKFKAAVMKAVGSQGAAALKATISGLKNTLSKINSTSKSNLAAADTHETEIQGALKSIEFGEGQLRFLQTFADPAQKAFIESIITSAEAQKNVMLKTIRTLQKVGKIQDTVSQYVGYARTIKDMIDKGIQQTQQSTQKAQQTLSQNPTMGPNPNQPVFPTEGMTMGGATTPKTAADVANNMSASASQKSEFLQYNASKSPGTKSSVNGKIISVGGVPIETLPLAPDLQELYKGNNSNQGAAAFMSDSSNNVRQQFSDLVDKAGKAPDIASRRKAEDEMINFLAANEKSLGKVEIDTKEKKYEFESLQWEKNHPEAGKLKDLDSIRMNTPQRAGDVNTMFVNDKGNFKNITLSPKQKSDFLQYNAMRSPGTKKKVNGKIISVNEVPVEDLPVIK